MAKDPLKISIITHSLNQGELLENTINSVLSQNYPSLEYIIIDGGSTDGSVGIIKKYADKLTYLIGESYRSKEDALKEGFKRSTGEIMACLGCGDIYFPWTFDIISQMFYYLPKVEWLMSTTRLILDTDRIVCHRSNFLNFGKVEINSCVPSESVFWKRSLWKRASNEFEKISYNMPISELWAHFWRYAILHTTTLPLIAIRYDDRTNLVIDCPMKSREIFFRKFLLNLPFIGYIVGYTRRGIGYNLVTSRWIYLRQGLGGNIFNFVKEHAEIIRRLILN